MEKFFYNGRTFKVALDSTDNLLDMAAVSGYSMEKLKGMIEEIINRSIAEEEYDEVKGMEDRGQD